MSAQPSFQAWEARVQATARQFRYPATPNVARAVRARITDRRQPRSLLDPPRGLAWALIAVLIVAAGLLAVPEVRAAIRSFLRIGAVEFVQPTPESQLPASPSVTSSPLASPAALLDLAGETTLSAAQAQFDVPLRLPTYPSDLGEPDRVYVQDLDGPAVVMVWLDPGQPSKVRLSLHALSSDVLAQKMVEQQRVDNTSVNGQPAVWVRGPHLLQFRDRFGNVNYDTRRFVDGHVLIWQDSDLTYRLETDLPLEDAVRIAESLQ